MFVRLSFSHVFHVANLFYVGRASAYVYVSRADEEFVPGVFSHPSTQKPYMEQRIQWLRFRHVPFTVLRSLLSDPTSEFFTYSGWGNWRTFALNDCRTFMCGLSTFWGPLSHPPCLQEGAVDETTAVTQILFEKSSFHTFYGAVRA